LCPNRSVQLQVAVLNFLYPFYCNMKLNNGTFILKIIVRNLLPYIILIILIFLKSHDLIKTILENFADIISVINA